VEDVPDRTRISASSRANFHATILNNPFSCDNSGCYESTNKAASAASFSSARHGPPMAAINRARFCIHRFKSSLDRFSRAVTLA
jgi:hypothetical protein